MTTSYKYFAISSAVQLPSIKTQLKNNDKRDNRQRQRACHLPDKMYYCTFITSNCTYPTIQIKTPPDYRLKRK